MEKQSTSNNSNNSNEKMAIPASPVFHRFECNNATSSTLMILLATVTHLELEYDGQTTGERWMRVAY